MRDTERERQRHRQRKKQAPCREPDVGLDSRTRGSRPGPKAGTKLLSHPEIARELIYKACLAWPQAEIDLCTCTQIHTPPPSLKTFYRDIIHLP